MSNAILTIIDTEITKLDLYNEYRSARFKRERAKLKIHNIILQISSLKCDIVCKYIYIIFVKLKRILFGIERNDIIKSILQTLIEIKRLDVITGIIWDKSHTSEYTICKSSDTFLRDIFIFTNDINILTELLNIVNIPAIIKKDSNKWFSALLYDKAIVLGDIMFLNTVTNAINRYDLIPVSSVALAILKYDTHPELLQFLEETSSFTNDVISKNILTYINYFKNLDISIDDPSISSGIAYLRDVSLSTDLHVTTTTIGGDNNNSIDSEHSKDSD